MNGTGDWTYIGNLTGSVDRSQWAPINSPQFTGTPTAPTPATANNSTQIATTEFVRSAIKTYAGTTEEESPAGASGARTATVVVAAQDTSEKGRQGADFLCSGNNDQTQIQSAIDALPRYGGKIVLLEGNYSISAALNTGRDAQNIIFEGTGMNTVLNVSDALADYTKDQTSRPIDYKGRQIVFRDMAINAKKISKHLYKGWSDDNVILDNVNLTMVATGTHANDDGDINAAFVKLRSFRAINSRIELSADSSDTQCYAVVYLDSSVSSQSAEAVNCEISLDGTNGRIHFSRVNSQISNSNVYLPSNKDSYDCGVIGGTGCMLNNCFILLNEKSKTSADGTSESLGGSIMSLCRIVNLSNSEVSAHVTLIGCKYTNFTPADSDKAVLSGTR